MSEAVQCLMLFFAGLTPQRPGFNSRPVYVGFVVDKVLLFFTVNIIPPVLHTHLFIYVRRYMILATESVVK